MSDVNGSYNLLDKVLTWATSSIHKDRYDIVIGS
jgi:hypothetical protein